MKTDNSKKLKTQKLLSVLTITIGAIFLLYGAYVEDDPNLVSLLIVFGAVWYFIIRAKIRSQNRQETSGSN